MNRSVSRIRPLLAAALLLLSGSVLAAKVQLDPSHWGHEAGEKCASCHAKASAGLALDAHWK